MRRVRRATITLLAVAAMVLGLSVAPVTAAPDAALIVFHGTANTSPLYLPGLASENPIAPDGDWAFQAPSVPSDFCIDVDSDLNAGSDCSIDAAGDLTYALAGRGHPVGSTPDVAIAGPYCGISQGDNGTGQFTSSSGLQYTLTNVGWITSAGGTLPVTGDWTADDGDTGLLVGLVQAQGGADCVSDEGAQEFVVLGVAAAIQTP